MSLMDLATSLESSIKENKPLVWNGGHTDLVKELVSVMLDFPEKPEGFAVNVQKPTETYKKVILVSGGADSTVMWHINKHETSKIGIYVDLGHSYVDKEIAAIEKFNIDYKLITHHLNFDSHWKHIIPTRNFLLMAYAEQFVQHEGEIWLGAVQGESAPDKGDKSELFFRLVEQYIWRTKRKIVHIKTLKDKTKNDWMKQYLDETGDKRILETITCFDGTTPKPCGKCQACLRKWISLRYCGIDTTDFFEIDPYEGGKEYIAKYKTKMQSALDTRDFTHYSEDRCKQDLQVILDYENNR